MSCGCLLSDTLKERNTIHNMTNTKIYKIWMHLKGMCYTKTDFNYHKVGAAGILMDESWIDKQMGLLNFYPMRRKTPCFSYGDIRRVHRIYASN